MREQLENGAVIGYMDVSERLRSARVAMLATVGAESHPHVVPICFIVQRDVLYFAVDEKPKRTKRLKRLENIQLNPRVSVLVDHYEENWSRLWWVRLDGMAQELEEGAEREHALALLAEKYEQYRLQPPTGPVVAIAIERSRGWAARSGSFDEVTIRPR